MLVCLKDELCSATGDRTVGQSKWGPDSWTGQLGTGELESAIGDWTSGNCNWGPDSWTVQVGTGQLDSASGDRTVACF
jgi:hypothetical protein